MKIYIARHGETDSNKAKKLMGQRIDEPLNAEGIRQAQELSKIISRDFDIIFTSPLKRAVETAKIISDHINVPIVERKELIERDFGDLSGKGWDEMFDAVSGMTNLQKMDFEQNYDYRPFGGESAEEVRDRLLKFVDELKKYFSGKKILVVAHGGILKMAHYLFSEEPLRTGPHNASLHEFNV